LQADWQDAIADQEIAGSDTIAIGRALQYFPVALLVSEDNNLKG
jgi:maltooligosyltrehalose synthase